MEQQTDSRYLRDPLTVPLPESNPSLYDCIQAFNRVVEATINDNVVAQQFESLTLQPNNSSATSQPLPLGLLTPIDQADTLQAPSDSSPSTELLADPWSIQDTLVQSRIQRLYKLLVAHFSISNHAHYLVDIVAGVEKNDFRVLHTVMLGWFDNIIGEIGRIFWIGLSREEVYDVLVAMGELGGGSYKVFMEVGAKVEGLEEDLNGMEL